MPTLITEQNNVAGAEMADLVYTYNQLTGKAVKRFESRAVAERRVEAAIMNAKDADGHTGVPKGTEPQARTRDEILAKAEARGVAPPPALDDATPTFQPGTLAYELDKAGQRSKPPADRPQPDPNTPKAPRPQLFAVVATFKGHSKPQAGSVRNAVLLAIQSAPKSAMKTADLDTQFEQNTRGYIQKLLDKNHLRVVDEAQYAALPAHHPDKPAA